MRSHQQAGETSRAKAAGPRGGRGFTTTELVVVLAVISVVSAFAVIGVKRAMASIRVQNSLRQLASRVELARTDAIRRHKSATVEFTSNKAYKITMDFDGRGVVSTRSYTLEAGVTVKNSSTDLPVFDFDWRGRTPQCFTSITMESDDGGGDSSTLSVSSAGDVTMDSGLSANMNAGTFAAVSATGDVKSGAVVSGAGSAACSNPCGGCVPPDDGPIMSTPPPGCTAFRLDKSFISIRKNLKSSGSFSVTVTPADTITVIQNDGRTNLEFTPSPTQAIGAGGSKTFTVKSKNNSTGYFPVKFISACNPSNAAYATVEVK